MVRLKWWMRAVGIFYIILAVQNLPFVVSNRLTSQYPGLAAPIDSIAVKALVDTWFLFGIEIGVVGVFLIIASANPIQNRILIYAVLALELLRGIGHDIYLLSRGYAAAPFYITFIVVHIIIMATGLLFLRRARRGTSQGIEG